ncbi:MAG: hypothetical protein H0V49_01175 [Nocardioidaceae bacterium]|nr:hypothetical protein [Nocardioidaceae bacterium]
MANGEPARFYREYIERVVHQHDMSAIDEIVSPDYVGGGHGWAEQIEDLREFSADRVAPGPTGASTSRKP